MLTLQSCKKSQVFPQTLSKTRQSESVHDLCARLLRLHKCWMVSGTYNSSRPIQVGVNWVGTSQCDVLKRWIYQRKTRHKIFAYFIFLIGWVPGPAGKINIFSICPEYQPAATGWPHRSYLKHKSSPAHSTPPCTPPTRHQHPPNNPPQLVLAKPKLDWSFFKASNTGYCYPKPQ